MATYTNNPSRYLRIVHWAAKRYAKQGVLCTHTRGYHPSLFSRIEDAAFRKYIVPRVI